MTGTIAHAQTTAANVSPDLQEIVKFAQAHMTDDVILAYIKNSGKSYNVSADDMLYLNSQGVSQPVISALLQTKSAAPAPALAPPPQASTPPPSAPMVPPPGSAPPIDQAPPPQAAPPPGLADFFNMEGGLNPAFWTTQGGALANLAGVNGSAAMMPGIGFGPGGMIIGGISGPAQFTGVQSLSAYAAPFNFTARVTGLAEMAIPFEVYLVSPDLRQWVSLAGHLGGAGHRDGDIHVGGALPFFHGAVNIPLGGGPSPDHGVWVNYGGSGMPISSLGNKITEHAAAGVPYTIQMTVGPDGMASVAFQDAAGVTLGAQNGLPVGMGPFYIVLATRNGPTSASWQSVQLTSLAPPPAAAVAPPTPTFDYFQAQLSPYGRWIEAPDVGSCWVPADAANPGWRPYMDSGHWEYTDAGWYWQSDYPWGGLAFHYGRWINDARTGFVWAWAPGYDWAPSWVCWRYADGGYMGWAPLPWGATFRVGVGLEWHGALAVDIGFGLGADAFVFIGGDHFWDHDYRHVIVDRERARGFYAHSEIHNGYHMDHGRFVAGGLGRDRVAAITHHEVVAHSAHEMRAEEEHHDRTVRNEQHPALARSNNAMAEREREPAGKAAPHGGRMETPENYNKTGRPSENYGGRTESSSGQYGRPGTPSTYGHPGGTTTGHGTSPNSKAPPQEQKKQQ
jgi:hypothetical protein